MIRKYCALLAAVAVLISGCGRSAPPTPETQSAPSRDITQAELAQELQQTLRFTIETGASDEAVAMLTSLAQDYEELEQQAQQQDVRQLASHWNALLSTLLAAGEGGTYAGSWQKLHQSLTSAQVLGAPTAEQEQFFPPADMQDPEYSLELALAATYMRGKYRSEQGQELVLTTAGDTTFGQYPEVPQEISFNKEFERRGKDLSFPLRLVGPFFHNDTLTILNCEGTFAKGDDMVQKRFRFKGPAEYTQMFVNGGVELVNLANNHSMDYKEQGYLDTKQALEEAGIGYYGLETIRLESTPQGKIAFLGYNLFNIEPELGETLKRDIARARQGGADMVVVTFHWGWENQYVVNDYQKRTGRQAVDCGADLVIGHHPHVMQGVEVYKGRTILYSLGNFSFGGDEEIKDRDTFIYRQSFRIQDGVVTPGEILIIPAYISTNGEYNNYQPMPLFDSEGQRIVDKLRQLSAGLAQPLKELTYLSHA